MQFVDDPGAKERVVQLAAAFAEKAFHLPFLAQPAERLAKINLAELCLGFLFMVANKCKAGRMGCELSAFKPACVKFFLFFNLNFYNYFIFFQNHHKSY